MKSAVITGATSFIGVHVVKRLLEENYFVYAIIRPNSLNKSRLPDSEKLKIIELEIRDIKRLSEFIVDDNIDVFYHFAWEGTRVPHRDDAILQKQNYCGALDSVEVAEVLKCRLFVGSGSQAEYGKFNGKVDEMFPCHPVTEYGKAKYRAYLDTKKIAEKNNMRFIWARIFSVYGKYDYSGTLIMSSLEKMKNNLPVDMTECTQMWDYIFVEDVADAFVRFALMECSSGVYNIASGKARELKSFVEEMKRIMNSQSALNFGKIPYGKEGPVSFEPVVDKLTKELNWFAKTSFEEGIRKVISGEE